jgi:hypothetical protein
MCVQYVCVFVYLYFYLYLYAAVSTGKRKTEAQETFLNLLTVCSSCKQKFVVCPFVHKEQMEVIRLQTD